MRGPFVKVDNKNPSYWKDQTWYTQDIGHKGSKTPLPYDMTTATQRGDLWALPDCRGTVYYKVCAELSNDLEVIKLTTTLRNKALDRFINLANDGYKASLGNTLAEWGQAHDMLVKRVSQLGRMARAVWRRDPHGFIANMSDHSGNEVRLKRKRVVSALGNNYYVPLKSAEYKAIVKAGMTGRYVKRDGRFYKRLDDVEIGTIIRAKDKRWADRWMELHFGWVPLLQDIYEAIQILADPPQVRLIEATASGIHSWNVKEVGWQPGISGELNAHIKIAGETVLTSPNLQLLDRLGLINPVSAAWEVMPFSFLLDWFVPVGRFIESWTDLVGFDFLNPYNTTYRSAFGTTKRTTEPNKLNNYSVYGEAAYMKRVNSIPAWKFVVPPLKRLSLVRGITAVALLVQLFFIFSAKSTKT